MKLMITVLVLCIGVFLNSQTGWALPKCPGTQKDANHWSDCKATYKIRGGGQYSGQFQDGLPHGTGVLQLKGGTYAGQFKEGRKHGFGVQKASNGQIYEGEWRHGKMHGAGKHFSKDGRVIKEGIWRDGKFVRKHQVPTRTLPTKQAQEGLSTASLKVSGSGTGFIINSAGNIVTNYHVIKKCNLLTLIFDGQPLKLDVIAEDINNDLAVLWTDIKIKSFLKIRRSEPYQTEEIFAAGFPLVNELGNSLKMTKGTVSALDGMGTVNRMQIDAALQPGNSGGPVIDKFGDVIGVSVAVLNKVSMLLNKGYIPEGINFAVKSIILADFLDDHGVDFDEADNSEKRKIKILNDVKSSTYQILCWTRKK